MTIFKIETNPDLKDVQFLEDQITAFNFAATGITDGELLAIFLRDDHNEIMAGLYGFTWGGTCEIRFLWVHEEWRGKGLGRELLAQAEAEALRRDCKQIVLSTHSFQAPSFYTKLEYHITGAYREYPRGHKMYFLAKKLSSI
jgi:GNAT superfamily N-acetyltransferase